MDESIIAYYGKQSSTKCGYCKGCYCSMSHGMHVYCMTAEDYQDLIDRGWRRCGDYCYKPDNKTTCCPSYTIRCDVDEFKLSKSHKKILKRMNRFLRDGVREKTTVKGDGEDVKDAQTVELDAGGEGAVSDECESVYDDPEIPDRPLHKLEDLSKVKALRTEEPAEASTSAECDNTGTETLENVSPASNKSDNSKPPPKKAKQMRLERHQAKMATKGDANESLSPKKTKSTTEKSIRDFINDAQPETDKHKLKLKLVKVSTPQFNETQATEFTLYQKYQKTVHNDNTDTVKSFLSFLHTTVLEACRTSDGPENGYTSYHQQYWLDDKLIAVGVIDLLPYCLSSVYFFYDPDYSFLSLGTYGSLREIDFVQHLAAKWPKLKYYYMGYYIRSCPKMRYKGKLSGSYLLCPETYTWQLLTDEICAKLDICKYQRLNSDANAVDANAISERDINDLECLLYKRKQRVYYHQFRKRSGYNPSSHADIAEFCQLVGRILVHRMVYLIDI